VDAYEQDRVMLLQAVFTNKHMSRFFVGNISDLPEGRESSPRPCSRWNEPSALKSIWRERNQPKAGGFEQYRVPNAVGAGSQNSDDHSQEPLG